MTKTHGSFLVSVQLRKDVSPLKNREIKATLFIDDNKDIPELPDKKINFKENTKKEDKTYRFYETKPIFLKTGHYRLKLVYDNELYWDSFFIAPGEIQKESRNTINGKIIYIKEKAPVKRALKLSVSLEDALTLANITKGTNVFASYKGKWVRYYPKLPLVTNGSNYFKIERKGYETKIYKLWVPANQDNLILKTSLVPKPGIIKLTTDIKDLKLKINDKTEIITVNKNINFEKIEDIADRKYNLAPGKYKFSFEYKGKKLEKVYTLLSGSVVNLNLKYDKKLKKLLLN